MLGWLVIATKKKNKETKKTYYLLGGLLVIIILAMFFAFQSKPDYDAFATCLVEEGFVMAGTEWCPHCKEQKSRFEGAFEDIITPAGAYKDCDRNMQWCEEQGVTGYPTWITPDGNKLPGVQSLPTLAKISGCPLQ